MLGFEKLPVKNTRGQGEDVSGEPSVVCGRHAGLRRVFDETARRVTNGKHAGDQTGEDQQQQSREECRLFHVVPFHIGYIYLNGYIKSLISPLELHNITQRLHLGYILAFCVRNYCKLSIFLRKTGIKPAGAANGRPSRVGHTF